MHQDWGERDERWVGIRSEVVELKGTSVHVLRADGPADGPTQLLVHGLGGSGTNWLEVMGDLARVGPVVAPDLPGFGRTEPPRPSGSRVRANVGFLRAFLRELELDRVTVHGNSMGGMLSVLLAEAEPVAVERLVLADPALPGPRRRLRELHPDTLRTFAPFAVPRLSHRVLSRLYARTTPEELFEQQQELLHHDPGCLRPSLREVGLENLAYGMRTPWRLDGLVAAGESVLAGLLTTRPVSRALDAVAAPTLLVWGESDTIITRPVVDMTLERRPDFELATLPDVGHVPMIEDPRGYLEAVTDFYARTGIDVAGEAA